MNLGLSGKVAMVAGASRGLGFAVARALAAEGVLVSMSSRNADAITAASQRIQQDVGGTVLAIAADVQSADAIARWHQATIHRVGGVDLVCTNSGAPPPGAPVCFCDQGLQGAFGQLPLGAVRGVGG